MFTFERGKKTVTVSMRIKRIMKRKGDTMFVTRLIRSCVFLVIAPTIVAVFQL